MLDVLIKVRELLSEKERWTTGSYARDIEGFQVYSHDYNAVKFCIVGAINRIEIDFLKRQSIYKVLAGGHGYLVEINDKQGYEAILKILDEQISRLQASKPSLSV